MQSLVQTVSSKEQDFNLKYFQKENKSFGYEDSQESRHITQARDPVWRDIFEVVPWRVLFPKAKRHVQCGATAKGYTHPRDRDDTAVRGASHRGADPRGARLTRGETPARASLSRHPKWCRIPSSSAPVDEQPGQASINQSSPPAPTESCVRLSRGQKHRPGGAAGGRGR